MFETTSSIVDTNTRFKLHTPGRNYRKISSNLVLETSFIYFWRMRGKWYYLTNILNSCGSIKWPLNDYICASRISTRRLETTSLVHHRHFHRNASEMQLSAIFAAVISKNHLYLLKLHFSLVTWSSAGITRYWSWVCLGRKMYDVW